MNGQHERRAQVQTVARQIARSQAQAVDDSHDERYVTHSEALALSCGCRVCNARRRRLRAEHEAAESLSSPVLVSLDSAQKLSP